MIATRSIESRSREIQKWASIGNARIKRQKEKFKMTSRDHKSRNGSEKFLNWFVPVALTVLSVVVITVMMSRFESTENLIHANRENAENLIQATKSELIAEIRFAKNELLSEMQRIEQKTDLGYQFLLSYHENDNRKATKRPKMIIPCCKGFVSPQLFKPNSTPSLSAFVLWIPTLPL